MSDERLVTLAQREGYVTEDQVTEAQTRCTELADRGVERSVWLILQDLGHISSGQANHIQSSTSSDRYSALEVEGYEIQRRIGRGGMGDVFLGLRPDGAKAAIKLLPARLAGDTEYINRFTREAQALERLRHPHITAFYGTGTVDGRPYLLMEFVEGTSLRDRLRSDGPLGETESRVVLQHVSEALQVACDQGLVHRDVKPANIILGPPRPDHDEPFCAKLCDFGLAKFAVAPDEVGDLTATGLAIGTPHYMSPEQATGDRSADPRHDVYGLGATIYHCLLGETMFSGRSSATIMIKQATVAIDLGPLHKAKVSRPLVDLLGQMLAKERAKRLGDWAKIRALVAALPPPGALAPAADDAMSGPTESEARRIDSAILAAAREPESRSVGGLVVTLIAVLIMAAGVAAYVVMPKAVSAYQATPTDLAVTLQRLADAGPDYRSPAAVVDLAPGVYQAPLLLTARHSNLVLRAGHEAGVRLRGEPGQPLIIIGEGAANIVLDGIWLEGAGSIAISVADDAEVELRGIRALGHATFATVAGGHLTVTDSRAVELGSGIIAQPDSRVFLDRSLLAGAGALIDAQTSDVDVRSSRLVGRGETDQALVQQQGGSLSLAGAALQADGYPVAARLEQLAWCELRDVQISGADTAIAASGVTAPLVDGVTLVAGDVGLAWVGAIQPDWTWRDLSLAAVEPATGIDAVDSYRGSGADPAVIARLPAIDP